MEKYVCINFILTVMRLPVLKLKGVKVNGKKEKVIWETSFAFSRLLIKDFVLMNTL